MFKAIASLLGSEPSHQDLSPRNAHDRVCELQVIDVRGVDEFTGPEGHIASARNLPLHTLADRLHELDPSRPVLAVCRSGRRSALACSVLRAGGFCAVYNLSGGMLAWTALGLPTRTSSEQPPVDTRPASREPGEQPAC